MRKLATGMRTKGFTLLEILVVLVIISITFGFALMSFGDFGASRQAITSAEHFESYLKLLQQQALIEMQPLGVRISSNYYETYHFIPEMGWKPFPQNSFFNTQNFPSKVIVDFKGSSISNFKNPHIIIHPSGDLTPFVMNFGTSKKNQIIALIAKSNGELSQVKPHE